jgi:hypothetical protein
MCGSATIIWPSFPFLCGSVSDGATYTRLQEDHHKELLRILTKLNCDLDVPS